MTSDALGASQPGPVSSALPMRDGVDTAAAALPAHSAARQGFGDAAAAPAGASDVPGLWGTREAGKKKKRKGGDKAAQGPSASAGEAGSRAPGEPGADGAAGGRVLSTGPQVVHAPAARLPQPAAAPDLARQPDQVRGGALAAVARQRASVAGQHWLFAGGEARDLNPDNDPCPAGTSRVAIAGRRAAVDGSAAAAAGASAVAAAPQAAGPREGAVHGAASEAVGGHGEARRDGAPATPEPAGAPARAGGAAAAAGSVDEADGDEVVMQPVRGEVLWPVAMVC